MLHIVNQAPARHPALAQCLQFCGKQATVLLIEDGVYAALQASVWVERLLAGTATVYVLAADAQARGLADRIDSRVQLTDYTGFVELCCQHTPIQSWH